MMIFAGPGVLVSLPVSELVAWTPSGSLVEVYEFHRARVSEGLRSAVDLAAQACRRRKGTILLVVRPEIFTHGVALDWLMSQLKGIRDHLCISDGTAVRPIARLRNHLFLYRRADHGCNTAFERLRQWAPELLASFTSQVNSFINVELDGKMVCPRPVLLQETRTEVPAAPPRYYDFVAGPSLEASVGKVLDARLRVPAKTRKYSRVTYIPVTETAARDATFMRLVTRAIIHSGRAPGNCVVLGLRRPGFSRSTLEAGLMLLLGALRSAGLRKVRTINTSLLFADNDPWHTSLRSLAPVVNLMMHESFEFWRYPRQYYGDFDQLQMLGPAATAHERILRERLLTAAFGRCPQFGPAPGC
jgi:hypothetical protein